MENKNEEIENLERKNNIGYSNILSEKNELIAEKEIDIKE